MQNIDVRFNATSNFGKVKADLAAVEAQAASLAGVFNAHAFARTPAVVDPAAWQRGSRAIHEASNAYRNAVSSSGLLTSQQIRATAESERYTKSLQKQKLTFGEMRKHSGIMKQVYADQLRYQRMTAQYWGTDSAGRAITDITIPKNVPRDLDTAAQKMYFLGERARSAGTQIINTGKNMQWAGRQLMVGFTYPVALFGAAAGVMAYKVDEAMTRVTKVYDVSAESQRNEAARVKELNDVRARSYEIASQAAKSYGQSIEDTLGVEQALAATGLSGDKLFESTEAVSRIATLGDLDLTASTDMTIALQTAFKDTIKTTDDLTNSFNFMNAVENATSLQIKDIAEMIPRAASAMSALGVTVEESTVLMTAMKEAGVNAAEGANALKSASGTILAPSPAAIEFIKELAGPKIANSMANLRDSTGGNLYQAIKQIYDMTRDLSASDRQAIIVKMFGKYQFNRVSAMVTNLGEAFDGTQNQARKAMDLMGEDSKTLGDRADKELAEKMEAVSGRFKAAWQTMRIELAKVGVPFLEIATVAADVGGKVLGFFNGMSDWKKKAALGVAAVLALAGPIIMLGGLFMNLGGQFISGSGRILSVLGRLGGAFALVTKEEQAATLAADAQNTALAKQQSRTSTLAAEIAVLTAAYEKATVAARAYAASTGVPVAGAVTRPAPTTYAAPIGPQLPPAAGPVAYSYPRGASAADKAAARDSAMRAAQMAEMKRIQAQEALNQKVAKEAALRERVRGSVNGANLGMVAMAASMGLMMGTSNETANNIGKWLMIATFVVPAVKILATMIASSAKSAWTMAAGQIAAARAARANAIATGATVTKFGALRAVGGGLASGIAATLGPGGVLTLGLLAVGGAYYWAWNKGKEAREAAAEAYRQQVALSQRVESSTRTWAEAMGKVVGQYERVRDVSAEIATGSPNGADEQQRLIDYYKKNPEGEGESPVKEFTDLYGDDLQDTRTAMALTQKFIDLQVEGKMSAKDAANSMRAFYIALGESATEADVKSQMLLATWGNVNKKGFDWSNFLQQQMDMFNGADDEHAAAAGKNAAEAFWAAMANSEGKPEQAQKLLDQFVSGSQQNIGQMWSELGSRYGREWYSMMEDQGVTNAQQFAELLRRTTMEELGNLDWRNEDKMGTTIVPGVGEVEKPDGYSLPWGEIEMELRGVNAEQDRLLGSLNDIAHFGDEVKSVFDLPDEQRIKAFTSTYAQANKEIQAMLDSQRGHIIGPEAEIESMNIVNAYNLANGLKLGGTYAEALNNFLNKTKAEGKGAADAVDEVKKNLASMPTRKTVTIRIKQVGGIVQTAMSNVQSAMADSAMDKFSREWDAKMDSAQQSWDNRSANLEASHEAAMSRLERGQENAQEAFDNRWEARKKAVEDAYQKRIDRVNREIEAEQKADEVRQRLFENEKNRLARLAELENTDIDFNTALNEGRLDDAAKTLNNAGADSGNAQMEAEAQAAEARTAARIKALEKKNERLEKARDKELENLAKLEERMRKHLERVQEARRKALEKQQADETAALEKSEEADMRSMERTRDYEEAMLEQRLELFKAYTARNQKDLERWMREVGLSYDDFGTDVKAKGKKWSEYFRTELAAQIRKAGTEVMNDNIWENVGKGIATKLLKGLGFENLAAFNRFVKTGERGGGGKGGDTETRHEGGIVGSGKGSRKGVPNTYKGLHRSERMVRAQKGEYVINKKASSQHRDTLDAINSGNYDKDGNRLPRTGGGYGGAGALMAGAVSHMFRKGVEKAFQNNYQKGLAKEAARQSASGSYGSAKPGKYGDAVFNAEQLKNAAIIASTASKLGASQRDIQIALMTAMQESTLRNLDWGDRDSVGLFQQRDAWGSFAARTNPVAATKMFFQGGAAGQRGLFDFPERGSMSLAQAAQAVQVSAYPDAYAKWANEASAIMAAMKKSGGGVSGPGGSKGSGKYWRASDPGKGWTNSHDYKNGMRSPVYAIGPGTVRTEQLPPSAGSGQHENAYPRGYGSYGVVSYLTTDDGQRVTYAHLYPGTQVSGRVQGGQRIALSASTGNSSGAHTHFEVNGSGTYGDAQGRFAAMGIPLRTGGTIKYDNTPASLHKGETVLTAPLTQKFKDNVASGGGDQYTISIDLRGAMVKENVDIEKAVNTAIDKRESKVGRKRVVK